MSIRTKPNIIFIMADDLGYGDIACFGNERIATPHIDRLAAEGLTFTDYHSNGAVCTPTRAALITGRYQQRAGLEGVIYVGGETRQKGLDAASNSIARALGAAGYTSGLFGKWHLGYKTDHNPVHFGFDIFRGYVSGNVDYHSHVDNAGIADWWHDLELVEEDGYLTDLVSDYAVRFIREHREGPFFLYVAHEAPHWPYQGRNDPADREPGKTDFPSWGSRQDHAGAYKEMIEAMDDGVGRILATLAELGLDEDTMVVFCSDNGPVPEVGCSGGLRGAKGDVYEGGHRVPAAARWPGRIQPGTTTAEVVLSMDWLPTFTALAGEREPAVDDALDGIDLSALLCEQTPLPERTVFFRYRDQAAARCGRWKLMRDRNETALYDLDADVAEEHDQAAAEPETAARLKAELDAWEADVPAVADQLTT